MLNHFYLFFVPFYFTLLAPAAPNLIFEECVSENNSITIAWQPQELSFVEGYILEFDDGNMGPFKVSLFLLIITLK